ncbi:MAG: hypothetical protein ACRD2G_13930, partial [Terriglobia bacterium]
MPDEFKNSNPRHDESSQQSRRAFLTTGMRAVGGMAMVSGSQIPIAIGKTQDAPQPVLAMPLDGSLRLTSGQPKVNLTGAYRFLQVGGKTGFQPLSLNTRLRIGTNLHCQNEGSILLNICPLETLASVSRMETFARKDPLAQWYSLLGDAWPARDNRKTIFAWQWTSSWELQLIAKFMKGWQKDDRPEAYTAIK